VRNLLRTCLPGRFSNGSDLVDVNPVGDEEGWKSGEQPFHVRASTRTFPISMIPHFLFLLSQFHALISE
jgi:hypothetical protein